MDPNIGEASSSPSAISKIATRTQPSSSSSMAAMAVAAADDGTMKASAAPSINAMIRDRIPSNHLPSSSSPISIQTGQLLLPSKSNNHRSHSSSSSSRTSSRIISQSNDIQGDDNFPMGCSFSPDGTCILTATASDGKFRLYDTPFQYLNCDKNGGNCDFDGGDDNGDNDDDATSATRPQHETSNTTCTYSHSQNYHPPTTPSNNLQNQTEQQNHETQHSHHPWAASLTSHQGGPPPPSSSSSYAWYPPMTSSSPLTSLYATCRGHSTPIHLIDAYTSKLRASYRPHNNVDEMEGPTVVDFSRDGRKIYGTGFRSDRTIAVFDTSIPGREGLVARLGKTRRSSDGQKGVPSALAFPRSNHNDRDDGGGGGPNNVFAVGTYSPASIYIYDDRMSSSHNPAGTIALHGGLAVVGHGRSFSRKKRRFGSSGEREGDESPFSTSRVNWFQTRARGGVTQLTWAPPSSNDPHVLFSASRRSDTVLSWDVRALSGSGPMCGLRSYARDGDTNQRLEFDFDGSGERMFVGSGSKEGVVKVYDVRSGKLEDDLDVVMDKGDVPRCKDAVNGVSYFPLHSNNGSGGGRYNGILAVAVGCRRFEEQESDDDDDESSVAAGKVESCPGFIQLHALKR
mmetsp:Transcript_12253/g.26468  ORF Transcript_12253/g.26468 Transcript_12253/m.26468 type:complete len:626 (+) Transcript_12253:145-2022(+)